VTRGGIIAGGVSFALLFGLPLVLIDGPWPVRAVVAWGVLSAIVAAVGALAYDAAGEEVGPGAEPPPKPAQERMSWKATLVVGVGVWAVMMGLGSIAMIGDEGFTVFTESAYWQVAGVLLALCLAIGVFIRQTEVTQGDIDEEKARRRAARGRRADDLTVLRSAEPADRERWYVTTRRLAWRLVAWQVLVGVPACAYLAYAVGDGLADVLPEVVPYVWGTSTAIAALAFMISRVAKARGDPLVVIGCVTGGIHAVEVKGGELPGLKEVAWNWIQRGHARTLSMTIEDAWRLRADGSLVSAPEWCGKHELSARRHARRRIIEDETCALLCTGAGAILYAIGELGARRVTHQLPGDKPRPSRDCGASNSAAPSGRGENAG
jgi:hypothetical protein